MNNLKRICKNCGKVFDVDKFHLSQKYCDNCKNLRVRK